MEYPSAKKGLAPYERIKKSDNFPVYVHIFSLDNIKETSIRPRHWHRSIEITYRVRFKGCIYINGKKYTDLEDTVYLVNSCDIHEIHMYPQKNQYSILLVLPYDFLMEMIPGIDHLRFEINPRDEKIKKIMLDIAEAYESKEPYAYVKMYGLVYNLLYDLLHRCLAEENRKNALAAVRDLTWEKRVLAYLDEHISEIRSIEEIAAVFGYSREAFCRKFKSRMGESCYQLLMRRRLYLAADLLKNSSESIEKICQRCGFRSMRSFKEQFLKMYHQTPEKYRSNR